MKKCIFYRLKNETGKVPVAQTVRPADRARDDLIP